MNEKNLWRKKKQSKGTKKILKLCKLKKFELKKKWIYVLKDQSMYLRLSI